MNKKQISKILYGNKLHRGIKRKIAHKTDRQFIPRQKLNSKEPKVASHPSFVQD